MTDMTSPNDNNSEQPVLNQPTANETFRKISSHSTGYDNLGYESPRRRVSLQEHAEMGPTRKKSILHNAGETSGYAEMGPVRKKSILHNAGEVVGIVTTVYFIWSGL